MEDLWQLRMLASLIVRQKAVYGFVAATAGKKLRGGD